MRLRISKHNINLLLLLAMIVWYTVPIIQENGGMKLIAVLIFLWFITCDFRHHRVSINLIVPYVLMMFFLSIPLLFGIKYYGAIEIVYFICSTFLLFFPIFLFFYYNGHMTKKETSCICVFFWGGLIYGAINTCVVLEQFPMASRLMATSYGDEYSKMGAGGFGFAYVLMLTFPLLLRLISSTKKERSAIYWIIGVLIFYTLVKCEYTTCLLLLLLGIMIYILYNSHPAVGVIFGAGVIILLGFSESLGNIFLWLSNIFQDTEVIAVRLQDVANAISENSVDALDSSRYSLYKESFYGFLRSPLWGTAYGEIVISGGHSTILDTLSIYGLLGLVVVLNAYIVPLRTISVTINKDKTYRIIIILFFTLSFLNPTIYIYQLGISVFFFTPLILNTLQRRLR